MKPLDYNFSRENPAVRKSLRVLVACETSGVIRNAFLDAGHDAWSCDLLPAEDRTNRHIVGDARDLFDQPWDLLMVAHPPCTRLCNSGARWLKEPPEGKTLAEMWRELERGCQLFSDFWNAPIPRRCIENPTMHKHAKARIRNYKEADQFVHPWWFGHGEVKRTGLWLHGLPPLKPTNVVEGRVPRVHWAQPGPDRWKERSRTYEGMAQAMVEQWGDLAWEGL